jgi:predicted nucleic acid-binding protein
VIVADASVVACALIDDAEDGTRARRRLLAADLVLVPEGVDVRVTAVLERLVRVRRLPPERAALAVGDLRDLPLERVPQWPFLTRAWQLRERLSMLQALTVAVAEAYDVTLVTGERAYLKAPGVTCPVDLL